MLVQWNEHQENPLGRQLVHHLFEQQVKCTPDAVAVSWEDQQLTYRELNEQANQLAHYLQQSGVTREGLVGLYLERSPKRIIGLLAILKAGGVYLPLEPGYPLERLMFMLEDSQASVIVTQESLIANLQIDKARIVNLERDWQKIQTQDKYNQPSLVTENNLAYVIYTSGSTGTPKGVLVEHQALADHCRTIIAHYQLTKSDRVLQFASMGFDVSLEQILPTLLVGATAILSETKFLTGLEFQQKLQELGLTVINLPPVYWKQWLQSLEDNAGATPPEQLRLVICGGEEMPAESVKLWQKSPMKKVRLLNAYGPTETTITAMTFEVPQETFLGKIPIGQPLQNRQVYILDSNLQPVPTGLLGELYIGGEGLARGYLNLPELTQEKFIPNPFDKSKVKSQKSKLYRTGDLARYLPDGNIEFLGRVDSQVKIRGFRIELGEIEAVLSQHPAVEAIVVIAREDIPGDKRLVAYVVIKKTIPPSPSLKGGEETKAHIQVQLRSYLEEKLPDYMVPSVFMVLDALPLTPNGKIDRRALPTPNLSRSSLGETFVAPRNPTEEILADIWIEILNIESIGIYDNFFNLGGHSLLATQIISRMREVFDREIPLQAIFQSPTIAQLTQEVMNQYQTDEFLPIPTIQTRHSNDNLPLSFAQQRLWFLEQLQGLSPTYNITTAWRLEGKLNIEALEYALKKIVDRHEILRTKFINNQGEPIQIICDEHNISVLTIDASRQDKAEKNDYISQIIQQENRHAFSLNEDNLIRCCLIKISPEVHLLLINAHHIITDGWSMGILVKELSIFYENFQKNKELELKKLPIQYADFALWQRKNITAEKLARQLDYWQQQLTGLPPILELPTDYPRPAVPTLRGSSEFFSLSQELKQQLKNLSQRAGTTLFMTLLTGFAVLLFRYTNQKDIAIGSPIANRNRQEIEPLIGFFVNTLVLRIDLKDSPSFDNLLQRVRQVALDSYSNQDVPFERLVEELKPERSLSYHPLFQVVFALQNTPPEPLELSGLTITEQEIESVTSKFDLTLLMTETEAGIQGKLEYNTDLFKSETITRMLRHFETLLTEIIANPGQSITELSILSDAEKHQLLLEWNQTQTDYPQDKCIHKVFEEQVEKTPEAVAVIYEDTQLTYSQLNRKANQLAHYLQQLGVKAETIIGICLERNLDMIVGLLAILKVGGTYLPLDPSYPPERLDYLLSDADISLILTQQSLANKLPINKANIISLDSEKSRFNNQSQENLSVNLSADNLAYINYTSGSTGNPKGVTIPHRGVTRLVLNNNYVNLGVAETLLHSAPLTFDASTFEIWGALLQGGKCVLLCEKIPTPQLLKEIIKKYKITTLWLTSALFNSIIDQDASALSGLKQLLVGGEALSVPHVLKALEALPDTQLFNGYGPTENTTFTCCYQIPRGGKNVPISIPIGRPIANTQVYILDDNSQPVPIGIKGELYIGGDGLARGYLNHPELTKEKFVVNPFEPSQRLYRTGDLARYLPDGNIEFIGRIDNQVKLRGFRIELGEIETILNRHPTLKESAVILREDYPNDKRLVAYVVANLESVIIRDDLRSYLTQKLPSYMIPSTFVILNQLPLTTHGKIDRRALPKPELSDYSLERGKDKEYIPPRNPVEEIITNIWESVLNIRPIGINNNFFHLGGHSLLAVRVIARLQAAFNREISLKILFEYPTIIDLAEYLENLTSNSTLSPIVPISRSGNIPLSFGQQRLWFLHQVEPQSNAYHIFHVFRLQGLLNVTALAKSLQEIVRRHEVLRTRFISEDGQPHVVIDPESKFSLKITDLRQLNPDKRELEAQRIITEESQKPFNLATDSLYRFEILCLSEQENLLLLNIHHIIFDGWSAGLLFEELRILYQANLNNQSVSLCELPIQYADYAYWQNQWLQGEVLTKQLDYWIKQLKGSLPVLELPIDYPRPSIQTYKGAYHTSILGQELSKNLEKISHQEDVSLFITLLAAFNLLLHRYSHQDDIIVGVPIAHRNRSEIEGQIGFFVNTLALRTNLGGNPSFRELLRRVREVTLGAYANQDLPFEKLIEHLQPERDLSRTPLFQVWFNMILEDSTLELSGLNISSLANFEIPSKFDLNLYVKPVQDTIHLQWVYNAFLFEADTIEWMSQHFQTLLEAITANPYGNLNTFRLLNEAETEQLFHSNNSVSPSHNFLEFSHQEVNQSVVSRFQKQVKQYPKKLAIKTRNYQWSYEYLNQRANDIAGAIRQQTLKRKTRIALLFSQDAPMIAAILGVIKGGNIYIPLDPNYPKERILYILQDSRAEIILTENNHLIFAQELTQNNVKIINVDRIEASGNENLVNLEISPKSVAYILYTSGSTGNPKGVIQTHRSILHFIRNYTNTLHVNNDDKLSLLSSYSFDAAVIDIFASLLNGATLCLFDLKNEGLTKLYNWLLKEEITIYHSVPTVFREFAEVLPIGSRAKSPLFPDLRLVVLGGEKVLKKDWEIYYQLFSDKCILVNAFGSTESSFNLLFLLDKNTKVNSVSVPIGYPLKDTEVTLVDPQGNPTDIVGEIAIKSPYIALGYWRKPELTKTFFMNNQQGNNKRIYLTGDWARRKADGTLEFLDRKDFLVKIRGFRIELGEVEAILNQHPAIKQTVVIVREDTPNKLYLAAYIIAHTKQPPNLGELRIYLQQKLPSYMIPNHFVFLDAFPKTPNNKIDRKSLPSPEQIMPEKPENLIAACGCLEGEITKIWQEVLEVKSLGTRDNFFELGGHSLLAVKLLAKLEKKLHRNYSLTTLFQSPTVEQMTLAIAQQEKSNPDPTIIPIQPYGSRPILFCIHILGRGLEFYRPLAKHLGLEYPLYGLNCQLMKPHNAKLNRVETLAAYYINSMRQLQPEGPYYLIGFSFGGKVAFEMAQQLVRQNLDVGFLGLVDSFPFPPARHSFLRRMAGHYKNTVESNGTYLVEKLREKIKGSYLNIKGIYRKILAKFFPSSTLALDPDLEDFMLQQENRLSQQQNRQASEKYILKPYPGRVTLFVAEDSFNGVFEVAPDLGWSSLVQDGLDVYPVPGNHVSMLEDPNVEILAKNIQALFPQSGENNLP